jgi:hypothetical protein
MDNGVTTYGYAAAGRMSFRCYIEDGHDSVVALVDPNASMVGAYFYDPYGTSTLNAEYGGGTALCSPGRDRGGYRDATEGDSLCHFGAGYDDQTIAYWTQPDPKPGYLHQPGEINQPRNLLSYGYAADDPVSNKARLVHEEPDSEAGSFGSSIFDLVEIAGKLL